MVVKVEPQTKLRSIPWVAKQYGISESLLYRLANAGNLVGCRRVGGRFFIYEEVFENWFRAGGLD